jgi:apurinic endonuclease APN1
MNHIGYHCNIEKKSFYKSIRIEHEKKDKRANAFQVFVKTPRRKLLAFDKMNERDAESCRKYINDNDIYIVAHSTYLINMANTLDNPYGIDTAVDDLLCIDKLGGRGSVFHVGKHKDRDYDECVQNMKDFIMKVIDETANLRSLFILETAAGCGTEMLTTIEELGCFYHSFDDEYKKRIKICIDTCHVFSAGYDLRTEDKVCEFIELVESNIGWKYVEVIHLNDSKTKLDSHVDRHENLGLGYIGKETIEGLKYFIHFCKSKGIPIILETPANEYRRDDMDILSQS